MGFDPDISLFLIFHFMNYQMVIRVSLATLNYGDLN